jgi:hypothetical protein
VDQEFQRALMITLAVGVVVAAIAGTALYVIFRRFEGPKAGGQSHMVLIGSLLAFVFLVCAALFGLSYSRW